MTTPTIAKKITGAAASGHPDDLAGLAGTREIPAWVISLGVHVLLLLIVFCIPLSTQSNKAPLITSTFEEIPPEEYAFDAVVEDRLGSEGEMNLVGPSESAATEVVRDRPEEIERELDEEIFNVDLTVVDEIPQPNEADFTETFEAVGATDHPGGVDGAMDRLTFEIINSLKERKTLVVWLFDESDSLKDRRNRIAERFETVYKQLGQLEVGADSALRTAVVGFNEDTHFYTEDPVAEVSELVPMIRNPRPPKTKNEHVFSAVMEIAQKWKDYRFPGNRGRANKLIFIITDERGDDYGKLEQTIQFCRRNAIRVYSVGNAAVFGREKGYITWTYEDGFKRDLPVDQGPETVAPERLQLPFWSGPQAELERMTASFGPYGLTRLCAETGGMYFVAAESRFGPRFDPGIMRNYTPDYSPIRDYQQELATNRAKRALIEAARMTWEEGFPRPKFTFRADNDNVLRREITEAQKPLAKIDYRLQELEAVISQGVEDREKLTSPRWQASFDLAIGRLYAWRVRAYGYNAILAEMKSSPQTFQKEGSNMWRLVPSEEVHGPPAVRRLAENAAEYLKQVIREHPGTPWAYLAQREMDQPMGWQWKEGKMNIPNRGPGNRRNGIQLADDEEKMKKQRNRQPAPKRTDPLL